MKQKKQYAGMSREELNGELNSEDHFLTRLIGGRCLAYILAPIYAAGGIYTAFAEDAGKSVKWLAATAFCVGAVKLAGYLRPKSEQRIMEIKSAIGNLEAKVEE